jgi:hydroxymethylpyrimidine pyrophosphatase-like HAD family hydrolase
MTHFRALALDLDGTLLTSDDRLSAENREAVRAAREAGYAIIIATGRWFEIAESVALELGVDGLVISCSGAQVRRLSDHRDVFDVRLPEAFARELYPMCDGNRCIAWVAADDGALLRMEGQSNPATMPPGMRQVPSLAGHGPAEPRVALVQGSAACELIVAELGERWRGGVRFDWSLSGQGKRLLTLTGVAAHKGLALAAACQELGIDPDEVVAFGDSDNDLELFRASGASVAMGQASDEVKQAATAVTVPGWEGGVAVAIGELLRTGRVGG